MSDDLTILQGDALEQLKTLPAESVQCVVTSPPYWGLRDYGAEGQIGREETLGEFLAKLVDVFEEVRRVLRNDGICWVNMGDCYAGRGTSADEVDKRHFGRRYVNGQNNGGGCTSWSNRAQSRSKTTGGGIKPKDLTLQPHRLAIALQDAGWWVRDDIVWHKPNPMPESCTDRPTRAHEYIFLLTKSPRYYYNADAIRNPPSEALKQQVREGYNGQATKDFSGAGVQDASEVKRRTIEGQRKRIERARQKVPGGWDTKLGAHGTIHREGQSRCEYTDAELNACGANARSVWTINTQRYDGAHFATFPEELPRRCILAGSRPGDLILDPFGGSGTTAFVALGLGRRAVTIELNPDYVALIRERCGLFALPTEAAQGA
jgi:site-specific DNA-methyltransferase (cytosine-N4-specific)